MLYLNSIMDVLKNNAFLLNCIIYIYYFLQCIMRCNYMSQFSIYSFQLFSERFSYIVSSQTKRCKEKQFSRSINVLPTWTPNYGLDLSKFFTNWQRDIITQCFTTDNSLWLKFVHEINFPFSKGFLCSDKVSKKQPTSKKWNEVLIMKEEHT